MPALAGEPWRGAARVNVSEAGTVGNYAVTTVNGGTANPTGDLPIWEGNPGDAITLTFGFSQGVTGPTNPFQRARVSLVVPGSGVPIGSEWNITGFPATGNNVAFATRTIHFDDDPLGATLSAAWRSGMLEIVLTMHRESPAATNLYTINSRGNTTGSPPATATFDWARGYLRSRARLAGFTISKNALGSDDDNFVYKDPTYNQAVLDWPTYNSIEHTLEHRNGSTVVRTQVGGPLGTQTTRNFTWNAASGTNPPARVHGAGGLANGGAYPVGPVTVRFVQFPADFGGDQQNAWADSGHAAGWSLVDAGTSGTTNRTLEYANRFSTDPRLNVTRLLQLNDNAFGTPPSSKDKSPQRSTSDLGFVAARVTNQRGEGVTHTTAGSGLAYSLQDANALVPAKTATNQQTTTQGGEAGWGPFMSWDAALPGGAWVNTLTFTDEAGTQQIVDNTHDFTLISFDPRVIRVIGGGNSSGSQEDHFIPGDNLIVAYAFKYATTGKLLLPDSGSMFCALSRLNLATGKAQYFNGTTWEDYYNGVDSAAATQFPLLASPTDPYVHRRVFGPSGAHTTVDTSTWGSYDLIVDAQGTFGGSPYSFATVVIVTGKRNKHSKYEAGHIIGLPA